MVDAAHAPVKIMNPAVLGLDSVVAVGDAFLQHLHPITGFAQLLPQVADMPITVQRGENQLGAGLSHEFDETIVAFLVVVVLVVWQCLQQRVGGVHHCDRRRTFQRLHVPQDEVGYPVLVATLGERVVIRSFQIVADCRDGVERVLPALPARRLQRCGVVRAVVEQHRVRAVDGRGDGQRHEREERVVRRAQRLEA